MEHTVQLDALPRKLALTAGKVASLVRQAGGRAFLVGGAVRDLLLGRPVKDLDIEVFGLEPARLKAVLEQAYPLDLVGLCFGVLKLRHVAVDVALPRRETKRGLGHKGFEIDSAPALSIEEAAGRRDFTVNALYADPLTGEVVDPHGGIADLEARVLRHVSGHFAEDPLRVLRGMQFVARFDLAPAPETVALCRTVAPEGLPPERLFEEWGKLIVRGGRISRGLAFLRETGWVRYYPELAALIGCVQDPQWHPEGDVWAHTCLCMDAFARERVGDPTEDLIVGLATLCHDFGKPAATVFRDGHVRAPGHDVAGREPTLSFLRRLTQETRVLREVPPLVENHMLPFALWKSRAGDAAVRRLALRVGRIDRLIRVASADRKGCLAGQAPAGAGEELRWLAAAADRLRIADAAPKPILQGRDLIAAGLKPSPRFSVLLSQCFRAQIEGAFSDREGALRYLHGEILGTE